MQINTPEINNIIGNGVNQYMASHPEILRRLVDDAIDQRIQSKIHNFNHELEIGLAAADAGDFISAEESQLRMQKLKENFGQ
jgi:hypothetical protein